MTFSRKLWMGGGLHKLLCLACCGVVVYCEWLAMALAAQSWPQPLPSTAPSVRLLLVSDPQMLSTNTEPYYPLSAIAVWDSSRFLRSGFHAALEHSRADVVLFLGDLLNDGSVVDDEAFGQLVRSFKEMFSTPPTVKLTLHIPGDNDVGGEWKDELTPHKVARFSEAFPSAESLSRHLFLEFVHIPHPRSTASPPSLPPPLPGVYRVLLSHEPVLPSTRKKDSILSQHPSLILSGHHHESLRFVGPRNAAQASHFFPLIADSSFNFSLLDDQQLHDIVVPTCSYRMGKQSYGFGLIVIDSVGWAQYQVLWLPSRFHQLRLYLATICVVLLLLLAPPLLRAICRRYSQLVRLKRGDKDYYRRLSPWALSSSRDELFNREGYRRLVTNT